MGERRLPMAQTQNLCESCNGACCRGGTVMELTEKEAEFMRASGAQLTLRQSEARGVLKAEFYNACGADPTKTIYVEPGRNWYDLEADCPHLVPTAGIMALCGIYHDPNKPEVCDDFKANSPGCVLMRAMRLPREPHF